MSIFDMFKDILFDDGAPEFTTERFIPFDIFNIVIEDEEEDDHY